jgi:Fe-S-cluster containining protein
MFTNINNFKEVMFSNCEACLDSCCHSSKFSLAPLILEDYEKVYQYFPILFTKVDEEWRSIIILNNGKDACPYLNEEEKCTIYEQRAPACKIYPLSPYYDQLFVDTSCKAVGQEGTFLASSKKISNFFYDDRLENFNEKLEKTQNFMKTIEKDLKEVFSVSGIILYKYIGAKNNQYIDFAKQSLVHLKNL